MHAKRLLAVFAILSAVSCGRSQLSDSIENSLVDLDGYLASRSVYEARRETSWKPSGNSLIPAPSPRSAMK